MATSRIEKQSFGENGAIFESGDTLHSGEFVAINIVEDAVFESLTWPELSGDTITGVIFSAGSTIYGEITAFKLTSGKVLAYKAA